MLDLQVAPERSLGNEQWEFVLGMPLHQAVQILQKHCRVINEVHVVYNDKNPFAKDIGLNLIHDGMRLLFDAESQRLKIIEVCDMKKVKLKYCSVYFNSPQVSPTIQQIDQSFGATHPAQFDEKHHMFVLTFRGITFDFPIEQQYEVASGFSLRSLPHTPSPVVSKMYIYTGNHLNETKAPPMPPSCYHGNLYSETTEVVLSQGISVGLKLKLVSGGLSHLTDLKLESFDRSIHFQDNVEDILTEIGSPCQTFYKMEDKMRIHSAGPHKLSPTQHSDYFYNYFTLGMDILFDGNTHIAKKFILHANHPGHYNFNIYYRSNFMVQISGENGPITITPTIKWSDVIEAMGGPEMVTEPVVLNRASSTNTTNPFGFTYCYAIQNMIFEVMSNDYIASVTLFQQNKNPVDTK